MEEKETLRQAEGGKKFSEMSVIFPLLTLYTLAYMGLMVYHFVSKGVFLIPDGMMTIYFALVTAYAADKEVRRWTGTTCASKFGSLFVYAWALMALLFFGVVSFKEGYVFPADLTKVVVQVIAVLFGSKVSKKIYETKKVAKSELPVQREEVVLGLIEQKGKVVREDVEVALKVAKSRAGDVLDEMEKRGIIKKEGIGKATCYVKN